jgi:hypothetical protein
MKAKLKVPRPAIIKKDLQASLEFKKNTKINKNRSIMRVYPSRKPSPGIKYWCQAETRLGLKTRFAELRD